jgi:hypothetical protein
VLARRIWTVAACVLALGLGACGNADEKQGVDEPAREGLALPLDGIDYNVFITRELNLRVAPDMAYYKGPEAPPGRTLYGVFIQVCNNGSKPRPTASRFEIVDNQGNRFKPTRLPRDNAFAYNPRLLQPHQCIPESGSVAQLGPTAGSMLLFDFPLQATENRPFELEIFGPSSSLASARDKLTVELDL